MTAATENNSNDNAPSADTDRPADNAAWHALQAAGDIGFMWDMKSDGLTWFGDIRAIFSDTDKAIPATGKDFGQCMSNEDLACRAASLKRHIADGTAYRHEYRVCAGKGQPVWVDERGAVDRAADGEALRLYGTIRIVTRHKQQESLQAIYSNYDALTGYLNAIRLRETLQATMAYNSRYNISGAFMVIGIDKLARVRESHGQDNADAILLGAGQRIAHCLRDTDSIGRIGDDRFGVILSQSGDEGLRKTAERVLARFDDAPMETPQGPQHIHLCIGGAIFPDQIRTVHDVMAGADAAHRAADGNCYRIYAMPEEQQRRQVEEIAIGENIKDIIREDRLALFFQPIVCSQSREIKYYEALSRVQNEQGEWQSAGAFIPVLEKLGLVNILDMKTLDMVVDALAANPDISLAVNVSGLTIVDYNWLRAMTGKVQAHPEVAARLMVEITETAALEDFHVTARFIDALQAIGCKVALDDFGAGHTSFEYIRSLGVNVVKIDGSFVRGITDDIDKQMFIRSLVDLSREFNLQTVAECVENEEEARIVKLQDVMYMQGYYFGKPAPHPFQQDMEAGRRPRG